MWPVGHGREHEDSPGRRFLHRQGLFWGASPEQIDGVIVAGLDERISEVDERRRHPWALTGHRAVDVANGDEAVRRLRPPVVRRARADGGPFAASLRPTL